MTSSLQFEQVVGEQGTAGDGEGNGKCTKLSIVVISDWDCEEILLSLLPTLGLCNIWLFHSVYLF